MATTPTVRVVVLAGGFGTRIRHLLADLPKPMAPVAGKPFVEWVVRFFQVYGFHDYVLSTGHLAATIEKHFAGTPVEGARVVCRAETTPLGTAGGFLNCVETDREAPDYWLVTNGDSLVVADPTPLVARCEAEGLDAMILGLSLPDASRFGSLEIDAERQTLRAFREKRPGPAVINGGVYLFRNSAVRQLPATRPLSFEYDVFPGLAAGGRVGVHAVEAPFIDIGTPDTLVLAEDFIVHNSSAFAPHDHDLSRL